MEERASAAATTEEVVWCRETVPKVLKIVCSTCLSLSHTELVSLLLVSPFLHRTLLSSQPLWQSLNFRELNNAGNRLIAALSLPRYRYVKHINLEFARDVEDTHFILIKFKDKNISDRGIQLVAENYLELESLNLTRCIKLTDDGLKQLLHKCLSLQSLNLYALSSLTDEAYRKISLLTHLKFLDLCGAQNLSDRGLHCISECKNLVSLNLTWCVRVTDEGVIAIAQNCTSLEFLSLFGIIGVTDKCLEALSKSCSNKITTLDVNGCVGMKKRSREELLQLFPYLKCFKVHS